MHSLFLEIRLSFALIACLLCGLPAFSFAQNDSQTDLNEAAKDANALAADVFNNALHLQQAINNFTHKKNVDDQATELVIYVSAKAPDEPSLSNLSLEIKLDGKVLVTDSYDRNEITVLATGASHKVYLGNLAAGSHDLVVQLKEDNGKTYVSNHGAIRFEKTTKRKVLELSVELSDNDTPPEVVFIEHS